MTRPTRASNRSHVGYWGCYFGRGGRTSLYILPNEIDMNIAVYEEKNMIPYFKGHTNPFILQ